MNVLFNYQVPVYTQRILELEQHSESNMLMATGTGKTVVSAHVARYYLKKGYRGLFLYNENEGLRQAEKTYRKVIGEDISYSTFYGQSTKDWNADQAQMLFASFQSMNNIYGKWYEVFSKDHFHFIIIDESHHDQAPTYKEVIDYFQGKKLRMTATPSDNNVWNETDETITLPQAIANGWLSQVEYSLLSDGINNRKLKQIMRDVLEKGQRISVKQLNENIFIKKRTNTEVAIIKRRAGTKQTMIFCENIVHAKHVATSFKQGTVGLVHSKQSETVNHNILESFKNKNIQFIISVDKFNEAIDIPDAEVIVFLRATNSKRIFFQQLGRGLRKTESKNKVIVLDFVGNVERLIMVAELGEEIKKEAKKLGHNLSKDIFNIKGKHYDLTFTETVFKDILKVIDAINTGFLSYEELKKEVIQKRITRYEEYILEQKRRINWPSSPKTVYNEWVDWRTFCEKFLPYDDLKKEVKIFNFQSREDYCKESKNHYNWPAEPWAMYRNQWVSMYDFLGKFLNYFELQKEVRMLGITSVTKYNQIQKNKPKWHSNPHSYYNEWISWPDFLNNFKFLSYDDLRREVRSHKFNIIKDYKDEQKKHDNWPAEPQRTYKQDWISYEDLIGPTFKISGHNKEMLSLIDLKKKVRKVEISSVTEYKEEYTNHDDWPSSPDNYYDSWKSWLDFFGFLKPKKGWMGPHQIRIRKDVKCSKVTINRFIEPYRESNPEYFDFFKSGNNVSEFFHPSLVKKIIKNFKK